MHDEPRAVGDEELSLGSVTVARAGQRWTLWAALMAVALVAGAVVVASSGDSDGPSRLPLALGAGGGGDAEGRAASAAAMLAAPITYVADDGLPALGGQGPAFRIDGRVDAGRVRTLARALGLDTEPAREDGRWRVTDGQAVLEVTEQGGGSWWYSPTSGVVSSGGGTTSAGSAGTASAGTGSPDQACPPDAACTTPSCPPDAACTTPSCPPESYCTEPVEPPPPVELPSSADARRAALDLLTATGLDLTDAEVVIDGPHDAWYVTVTPRLDGLLASGWVSSVVIGAKGVTTSASGSLGIAEHLGSYPLVDTRAAIDRLNAPGGGHGGQPVPMGAAGEAPPTATEPACAPQPDGTEICQSVANPVACDVPAATLPAQAPPDGSVSTLAPPVACPEPVPYDPPEPMTVVLTEAEPVLVMQYAIDGSDDAYLVPGYRFASRDGHAPEVVAVDDDHLAPSTIAEPPPTTDPLRMLGAGETAEIGVGYYVEVTTHCGWFTFADRWWATDGSTSLRGWSEPTEGGTFTLDEPDRGVFVGDYEGTKQAVFSAQGPADELPGCD